MNEKRKILIVGGGFAGIRAALDLSKRNKGQFEITLLSNKYHFEYYPRIYKVVTGNSPLEVCIRLDDIFQGKNVTVLRDTVVSVNPSEKTVSGQSGSTYRYDDLVIALGSETSYFNIEGVKERAFGFKSISEALKLKNHLHSMFDVYLSATKEDLIGQLHIVIVGGGPSGIELAGELKKYMEGLADNHGVDNNFVTIDIIEAAPRLAPTLPEKVSHRIYTKLHSLGINIFLNRAVVKEDVDQITMKDMSFKSNTMIWTAGSRTNHFYESIPGLQLGKAGRVVVDEYLRAKGVDNVYIMGDAALTPYAGLAQTAIYDGHFVAKAITAFSREKKPKVYAPRKVAYAVPVGSRWAAVSIGPFSIYGFFAWVLREFIDLRFFLSILPFRKALRAFRSNEHISESCLECLEMGEGK